MNYATLCLYEILNEADVESRQIRKTLHHYPENCMTKEDPKPHFIPGLMLAQSFFNELVEPIIDSHLPQLKYSAALIGTGSEVLGFDTEMSTDHGWGPRVMLFLRPGDLEQNRETISKLLREKLPPTFRGYSTSFTPPDPEDNGVQHLTLGKPGSINHRVELFTISDYFEDYMDIRVDEPIEAVDWLTLQFQILRSIIAGGVFRDDLGLDKVRERFRWYPRDVWFYILASCWSRLGEEEQLMGRAGIVGDEIGSSLIASRLVHTIMRLAFLMERVYPPYAKWFGTAFDKLKCSETLKPLLEGVIGAPNWKERDALLAKSYSQIAILHNQLQITPPLPDKPTLFHKRPFQVIHGERFAESIKSVISGKKVKAIAAKRLIGNIDMISDNTDLLEDTSRRKALFPLYL